MKTRFALVGGTIIDCTGAAPLQGMLIISEGKIESIESTDGIPGSCEVIDITGCTVLPGFVHAHTHPGFKLVGEKDLADYELDYLDACISAGVTTVRDMGALNASSIEDVLSRCRQLNATGTYPYLVSAGKFLAAPGGYGGAAPLPVSTVEEARARVKQATAAGAGFIKTSLENGFSPDTALPKLAPALLAAICEAAREHGLGVAAHLSQCEPLRVLVEAGITDAEHVPYEPMDHDLIDLMAAKGVHLTPTLTLYRMFTEKFGAPLLGTALENVRRFHEAGGRLAVGDDYIEPAEPWYRPGLPYGELELLAQAGLTNMEILRALTANGAEACGLGAVTGTLEAGKLADIVVVRGDPLASLSCLKDVAMVVARGKIVRGSPYSSLSTSSTLPTTSL